MRVRAHPRACAMQRKGSENMPMILRLVIFTFFSWQLTCPEAFSQKWNEMHFWKKFNESTHLVSDMGMTKCWEICSRMSSERNFLSRERLKMTKDDGTLHGERTRNSYCDGDTLHASACLEIYHGLEHIWQQVELGAEFIWKNLHKFAHECYFDLHIRPMAYNKSWPNRIQPSQVYKMRSSEVWFYPHILTNVSLDTEHDHHLLLVLR